MYKKVYNIVFHKHLQTAVILSETLLAQNKLTTWCDAIPSTACPKAYNLQ